MGAESIYFTLTGKATVKEIKDAFQDAQEHDSAHNGHQDGYSGDFQTVNSVNTSHLDTVFPDFNAAYEFCLDKAEKWCTVVAVRYKVTELKPSKQRDAATAKVKETFQAIETVKREASLAISLASRKVKCKGCENIIAPKNIQGVNCPVCRASLMGAKFTRKIGSLTKKLHALKAKVDQLAKRDTKEAGTNTIIAGWGAC